MMRQNRIKSPCFNCVDRQLGCHSACDRYNSYLVDKNEFKEKIINAKKVNNEHNAFIKQQHERYRKNHR